MEKALKLYKLISPYIPPEKNIDSLEFINKIFDAIIERGGHSDYNEMIILLTGKTIPEWSKDGKTPEDVLTMFIEGLVENSVLSLLEFCRNIGL